MSSSSLKRASNPALAAAPASNAASADLVFKMSKKIAQLTKVIYFLNTKNEDREVQLKHVTTMYEQEIESVH
jgi:hypothetical protein